MENEITKLSKVKFIITEEVIERKWQDAISKRNSLLSISDWTQLLDCELPQNAKSAWLKWRKKVRSISRKTVVEPDNALHLLKALESQMPKRLIADSPTSINENNATATINEDNVQVLIESYVKDNVIPKIITIEDIAIIVKDNIANVIQDRFTKIEESLDKKQNTISIDQQTVLPDDLHEAKIESKHLINSKCNKELPISNQALIEEALDISIDPGTIVNILPLYAKYYNKSLVDTAAHILLIHKEHYKICCSIEEKRLSYFTKVDNCDSVEQLTEILKEFLNGY